MAFLLFSYKRLCTVAVGIRWTIVAFVALRVNREAEHGILEFSLNVSESQ